MKYKLKLKNLIMITMLASMPILLNTTIINADTIEDEFLSVINKYKIEDVVVEEGISLEKGKTLDLSQYPNWELSDDETIEINSNGVAKAVNEGTVFLSQRIGKKVYIVEIYVPSETSTYSIESRETRPRGYYKVFIDAGHGGSDPGALGFGYKESDINLQVAKKVESKLKAKGIDVKMSRTSDVFYSTSKRAEMANDYGADVFVSIHQNAATNTSAKGIETYYNKSRVKDKPLSEDVQQQLISQTAANNRGVKDAEFTVLVESNMTAALVECGFISNKDEVKNISNSSYQDKLATGIANGIESYLKDNLILNPQKVIATGTVTVESLNVRSGYGTTYNVIGTLSKGTKVQIVETHNGWYKILFNSRYGYVSGSYVDIDTTQPPIENNNVVFSDISDHWAKAQIEDFVSNGYIKGYDDNTFRPNNDITRAEFIRIVNQYFGFSDGEDANFTDVNKDSWYYKDICIGIKQGYINGYQDNTFRPSEPISREEAATIVRAITGLNQNGTSKFDDDNDIGSWAKESVYSLSDNKIMYGYEDNTFRPKNKITRAEAVTTLSRVSK